MILAKTIHEEYKRQLNRINSEYDQRVGIIDGDAFINGAIDIVFENLAVNFEKNTLSRNYLRQLEVKNKKLKVKKQDKDISYVDFPEDLYMLTRQVAKACKDDCDTEKILDLYIVQTSDLTQALKDPNWEPSFEWEQALAEDAGNSLFIYHNCKFNLKTVTIDYLRRPKYIATPSMLKNGASYIRDGVKITNDINFEITNTQLWRLVVAVAVLRTKLALGDLQDYNTELQNVFQLYKIYLN